MFYKKLHIVITLAAALAAAVISILGNDNIYDFSIKIVVTIVVFYIVGSIVKGFLDKKVFKQEKDTGETAEPGNKADEEDE